MPLPDLTKPAEEFGNLIAEGVFARATYYVWATRLVEAGRELTTAEAEHRIRALSEIHEIDVQVARKGQELTEAAAVLLTREGGSEELSRVLGLSVEPDPTDGVLAEAGSRQEEVRMPTYVAQISLAGNSDDAEASFTDPRATSEWSPA